jgi:Protein of unknown function (DUF2442)
MLHFITKINNIIDYQIICTFNTNEIKKINFHNIIQQYKNTSPNLFGKLENEIYFKSVHLDDYGTLCWDNGLDFCPDVLFDLGENIDNN